MLAAKIAAVAGVNLIDQVPSPASGLAAPVMAAAGLQAESV